MNWASRAATLADELAAKGKLRSPALRAAIEATPRHEMVPAFWEQTRDAHWHRVTADDPDYADKIWSNAALFTDVVDGEGVSSTSTPGLMARMIESLDVRPGHRVLEIGTGTGYNTAWLCHLVGDRNVTSIDINYVDATRDRLAAVGHRPRLVTGDGADTIPELDPVDRLISTVAVPHVPTAWLHEVVDGGVILVDLKIGQAAGNLVRLTRHGEFAEGRFDPVYAAFMSMRHPSHPPAEPARETTAERPETGTTELPAAVWDERVAWFLISLTFTQPVSVGYALDPNTMRPVRTRLTTPDGSWAEVTLGGRNVWQAGPTRIWDLVEQGYAEWMAADRPGWERLGLTINADMQWVWIDHSLSNTRWQLPNL